VLGIFTQHGGPTLQGLTLVASEKRSGEPLDGLIKAGSSGVLHFEESPRSFPRRIVNSFTIDFVKRPSGSSLPQRRLRPRPRVSDAPRNMTESIAGCSGQQRR